MHLSVIGGKAIFVPTPGQTEQQYSSREIQFRMHSSSELSNRADSRLNIPQAKELKGFPSSSNNEFREVVDDFLSLI